jgi:hypothetical protein
MLTRRRTGSVDRRRLSSGGGSPPSAMLTATATATAAVDGVSSASDFMAGFLRKLKVGKGWKQRYVTVAAEGCTLEYKKHKTDSRPLRSIDLSRAVVLEHVPPERLAPDAVRSKSWKGSTLGDVPEARCARVGSG